MSMPRRVPTSMSSGAHLVRALERCGFKRVEHHAQPQALLSWRGQPLGASAEIIVRRSEIGATADDLGFTRGEDARWEALVSNILLSRFDRRWFEKLCAHYEAALGEDRIVESREPPSAAPKAQFEFATPPKPSLVPPARAVPPPEARSAEKVPEKKPESRDKQRGAETRRGELAPTARSAIDALEAAPPSGAPDLKREIAAVLNAGRIAGGGGIGRSCLLYLLMWVAVAVVSAGSGSGKPLLFGTLVLTFLFVKKATERRKRMVDAALGELRSRLRYDLELRAQVLRELRRTLDEQPAELRPLVQDLVRRIELAPLGPAK